MIKEYWSLTGWERYLSLTWELDFFQACGFRRMLMKHKNLDFTQISDKTNDVIFLKVEKPCFGGIFDHFCMMEIFSKTSDYVTHNYTPNIMLSFRKN